MAIQASVQLAGCKAAISSSLYYCMKAEDSCRDQRRAVDQILAGAAGRLRWAHYISERKEREKSSSGRSIAVMYCSCRERRWVCKQQLQSSWRAEAHEGGGRGQQNGYVGTINLPASPSPPAAPRPYRPPAPANKLVYALESFIEKTIFNCRFLTLLAVVGSLSGSMLCFIQGCRFVTQSFIEYVHSSLHGIDTGHVIILLVEAIDIFLVATVMLIFGMGVYELFVNTVGLQKKDTNVPSNMSRNIYARSNLFGLFRLEERPRWLEIRSLHELKTKVGHVIVMILLVGMFENSKKVPLNTGFDLLCFSGSILMSSGCLFLLSKLHVK